MDRDNKVREANQYRSMPQWKKDDSGFGELSREGTKERTREFDVIF